MGIGGGISSGKGGATRGEDDRDLVDLVSESGGGGGVSRGNEGTARGDTEGEGSARGDTEGDREFVDLVSALGGGGMSRGNGGTVRGDVEGDRDLVADTGSGGTSTEERGILEGEVVPVGGGGGGNVGTAGAKVLSFVGRERRGVLRGLGGRPGDVKSAGGVLGLVVEPEGDEAVGEGEWELGWELE